jgi:hypothetical protein
VGGDYDYNYTVEFLLIPPFATLWSNYRYWFPPKHINPKTKKENYDNKCAIKVSDALFLSGIPLTNFRGAKCEDGEVGEEEHHALRATELASWLESHRGFGKPKVYSGETYFEAVKDKKGLIYFEDYWAREGETQRTGDHIDLWKAGTLASCKMGGSIVRRAAPTFSETHFSMSDLSKSKRVLFWEIK